MNKIFLSVLLFFVSHLALASTECEIVDLLKILPQAVCEHSKGRVYHLNGAYAGSKGSVWYYSNGQRAGYYNSRLFYSNGQYAGAIGSEWRHPNGQYAGRKNSVWYHSNGRYAGLNNTSWFSASGKHIGSFSGLSELEQLKMVLE